jgi:hypothetical protein
VIRAYLYGAIVVGAIGALAWGGHRAYTAGAEAVRVEWAQADAAAAEAARLLARERAAAVAQVDAQAVASARRAAADRGAAAVAGVGLRFRAQTVAAACDSGATSGGDPAPGPGALLADVLGRLEAAGRELAATADERGNAGQACQAAYAAMKGEP